MTTIAAPRQRNDNLAQRWLRTGGDHARADAPSHRQSQPATAAFNDNLDHQIQLLLSAARVSSRLAPSASAKSP